MQMSIFGNISAQMNIWLHKQVMKKVAEGGGKMPESIKKAWA
jgi:hypothetical protein